MSALIRSTACGWAMQGEGCAEDLSCAGSSTEPHCDKQADPHGDPRLALRWQMILASASPLTADRASLPDSPSGTLRSHLGCSSVYPLTFTATRA